MYRIILSACLVLAVVCVLATPSPARADDPIQLEMWRAQQKLNSLIDRRIGYLENRVAILEAKAGGTAYQPGAPPPRVTPVYSPPPAGYSPYGASGAYTVPPCPLPDVYTRNLK